MKILVTGCAGFIGFHLCKKILSSSKDIVIGIDNLNNYYDVELKKNRLKILKSLDKTEGCNFVDNFEYNIKDNWIKLEINIITILIKL